MQYQPDQLESIREAFRIKYKGKAFPSGEHASIYTTIQSELLAFSNQVSEACFRRKSEKCSCSDAKKCKSYFPDKKSERLYASNKQLSQLLYSGSKIKSFWPGFIKLCCLFVKIPILKLPEINSSRTVGHSPLLGKWKYACTSFDKSYQHGGEFTIAPQIDGRLKLNGYRMWKGLRKSEGNRWKKIHYDELEYTQWSSVFIFEIDNEKFAFEYEIPQKIGNLRGYCRCSFVHSKAAPLKVYGDFYELNSLITGQIVFEKIESHY